MIILDRDPLQAAWSLADIHADSHLETALKTLFTSLQDVYGDVWLAKLMTPQNPIVYSLEERIELSVAWQIWPMQTRANYRWLHTFASELVLRRIRKPTSDVHPLTKALISVSPSRLNMVEIPEGELYQFPKFTKVYKPDDIVTQNRLHYLDNCRKLTRYFEHTPYWWLDDVDYNHWCNTDDEEDVKYYNELIAEQKYQLIKRAHNFQ
jgi:hypothetical protein